MDISQFSQFLDKKLHSISRVALIAHKAPDGDAYGSLEGMRMLLQENYPHIHCVLVLPRESTDTYWNWILGSATVERIPADTELLLFLDASPLSRTALAPEDYPTCEVITIDHHEMLPESLEGFRDIEAPSTTTILSEIAQHLHWKISPHAATALLLGIYADTGGFLHRNSTQRAFLASSFLLASGADQASIIEKAFGNYTLSYLHDLGRGLLAITVKDNVACLFLPNGDENPHLKNHIITYLSGIADMDIACILTMRGGEVKGSFRTRRDDIDVNELAKKLGGGGHKKASGFTLKNAQLRDDVLVWEGKTYTPEEWASALMKRMNNEENE